MKRKNSLLIFMFSMALICMSASAQVNPEARLLAQKLKRDLDLNVEFASLILRVGGQIDREIAPTGSAKVEDFLAMENRQIEKILQEKVMHFADFYEKNITLPETKKGLFRRYFPLLQWGNIADVIKSSTVGLSGFFKRKGVGVVIGIALGVVAEYSSYFILYQAGLPQLLPLAMATPYGTIFSTIPLLLNRFKLRSRLKKVLGGKAPYKAYLLQMKESLKKLKLRSPDQILFPLNNLPADNQTLINTLTLSKNTWWHFLMTKLGLNPKNLSYHNLKLFLLVNPVEDKYIKWVTAHEGLPLYMKTALITDHLLKVAPPEVKTKFLSQFSNNFTQVRRAPYWIALKDWTFAVMEAKTIGRIRELMAEIPPGVAPEQIIELWDKIILPYYSTNFDMSYSSYRQLQEKLTILKAEAFKENAPNWNAHLYKSFEGFISQSLGAALPTCETPEKSVLRYMLKSP